MALSLLKSQLPGLVEKFEPEIENALRSTLRSVKTTNPSEANLFYTNWKKLNSAIEQELGPGSISNPTSGGNILNDAAEKIAGIFQGTPATTDTTNITTPEPVSAPAPAPEPATGFTAPPDMTTEPIPTNTTAPTTTDTSTTEPELGGRKRRHKRKTAKQHKKRTHRVKHRKH